MSEPSLADQLWSLFNPSDSMNHDYEKAGRWVIGKYSRILAALRVAEIVREPTDEQAFLIDTAVDGAASVENGSRACATILALANEAGERDA